MIFGLVLVADWLMRSGANPVEGLGGLAVASSALPATDGLSLFELTLVGARFVLRSSWIKVTARDVEVGTEVKAGATVVACGFELIHRGRLDLSGRDVLVSEGLVAFADALSSSDARRHFSVHVLNDESRTRTALVLSPGLSAPDGWRSDARVIGEVVNGPDHEQNLGLERWRYLRDTNGPLRVLRISDFSGAPVGRQLLERLQFCPGLAQISLHVEVLDARRAQGIAARAVHRSGSDAAATSSVGFRRSARTTRAHIRLRESEQLVANGRSLLQIGVFVVVRANDLTELDALVTTVRQGVLSAGLRCQLGAGRQALWYCQQLPGGPGW